MSVHRRSRAYALVALAAGLALGLALWIRASGRGIAREAGLPQVDSLHALRARALAVKPVDKGIDYRRLRERMKSSPASVLAELRLIARLHPAEAIDLAQALGRDDEEKAQWVMALGKQWADSDPQAAWQWVVTLSNERMSALAGRRLADVVLESMASKDPQLVVTTVNGLMRDGNASEAVSTAVAMHLGMKALVDQGDVSLAKATLEAWESDPAKPVVEAAAIEAVAFGLSPDKPGDAGQWLQSLPASDQRTAALVGYAAHWAESDPKEALEWAGSLSAEEGQQAALKRTVSDWVEKYPDEVGQWLGDYLSQNPPDADSDKLVEILVNMSPAVGSSPASALQWESLISDPTQRAAYQDRTLTQWASKDPNSALQYVQGDPSIPQDLKQALVQKLQRGARG